MINMDVNFEYIDPYDTRYNYLMRVEHLGRYLFAKDLLKGYKNILDFACSNGYGTKLLSETVTKITGIDKSIDYLNIAKDKYNASNITYKKVNIDETKLEGTYDGIVCLETLEHLKYPSNALSNLYDILESNGTLILSIPNSNYEIIENGINKDTFHLHVFKLEEIIDLIDKVGFKIIDIYGQSYINKIINNEIDDNTSRHLYNDALTIGYPNKIDINKTYSYIFVLTK